MLSKFEKAKLRKVPPLIRLFYEEVHGTDFTIRTSIKRACLWRSYKAYLKEIGVKPLHGPGKFYTHSLICLNIKRKKCRHLTKSVLLTQFNNYDVFMNVNIREISQDETHPTGEPIQQLLQRIESD